MLLRAGDRLPHDFAGLGNMAFALDIRRRSAEEVAATIQHRMDTLSNVDIPQERDLDSNGSGHSKREPPSESRSLTPPVRHARNAVPRPAEVPAPLVHSLVGRLN